MLLDSGTCDNKQVVGVHRLGIERPIVLRAKKGEPETLVLTNLLTVSGRSMYSCCTELAIKIFKVFAGFDIRALTDKDIESYAGICSRDQSLGLFVLVERLERRRLDRGMPLRVHISLYVVF